MKSFFVLLFSFCLASSINAQTVRGWDANGRPVLISLPSLPTAGLSSITVNGQRLTGDVTIAGASVDPFTNTVLLNSSTNESRGNAALGNTTVAGTLTVTSGCFFNTAGGATTLGSNSAPNPGVLIFKDGGSHVDTIRTATQATNNVYTIPDAGGDATFALRVSAPASSAASGVDGNIAWDDNFIYVYTSTGWKQVALSSY